MLTFCFSGVNGEMVEEEILTSGMVGKQARLKFTSDWDKLRKAAVFSTGEGNTYISRTVMDPKEIVTIPADVLKAPERRLYVGIYGVSTDGKVITPTIRAAGPWIEAGAEPTGDTSTDPTLPVWAQIQSTVGDLNRLSTEEKENLVAAVNELAARPDETMSQDEVLAIVAAYLAENPPEMAETDPTVPGWAKQASKPSYTAAEVGALPADTVIPTKVSELSNDSAFITKSTAVLENYYKKTETYTQEQIAELISAIDLSDYALMSWVNGLLTRYQLRGDYALRSEIPVQSVNGQIGTVVLSAADVQARSWNWLPNASEIGAVPTSRTINGKMLSNNITLTASDVAARSEKWLPNASEIGAVPISRTINGRALSANVILTATDVGAVPLSQVLTMVGVDTDGVEHTWNVYGGAL